MYVSEIHSSFDSQANANTFHTFTIAQNKLQDVKFKRMSSSIFAYVSNIYGPYYGVDNCLSVKLIRSGMQYWRGVLRWTQVSEVLLLLKLVNTAAALD